MEDYEAFEKELETEFGEPKAQPVAAPVQPVAPKGRPPMRPSVPAQAPRPVQAPVAPAPAPVVEEAKPAEPEVNYVVVKELPKQEVRVMPEEDGSRTVLLTTEEVLTEVLRTVQNIERLLEKK